MHFRSAIISSPKSEEERKKVKSMFETNSLASSYSALIEYAFAET